jgi:hypothetical protein
MNKSTLGIVANETETWYDHYATTDHLLTYSMDQSPWWKTTVTYLVKKFPALYETLKFITVFIRALHKVSFLS